MHRGFIALISTVIISAILLTVIVAGSLTGFNSRFNVFDAESKERSHALADACVDIVLIRLSYDATYGGPETIPVGDDECQVVGTVDPISNPRVYKLKGGFQDAHTNLLVTIEVNTLEISSWQEVANL